MKTAPTALLLCALCLLAGCASPSYYGQAVAGHLELMRNRQDVAELLAAAETEESLKQQLLLAREIRRFAIDRLGLPDNGSYRQYVGTGREAVAWNVVAAPEFSLEPKRWCFLFAGCVPYRGYFDPADARRLASKLGERGFDVAVSPAMAYSTLGWFRDPLLDTMFRYSEENLAGVIFHEFAHQQLYVKGDTAFSESYATFIEELGVTLWLEETGRGDRLPAWRRQQRAAEEFSALLDEARVELEHIYSSAAPTVEKRHAKAAAFKSLRKRYLATADNDGDSPAAYAGWFEEAPNNARMALFDSYRGGACAFAALYEEAGRDLSRFQALAAERAAQDSVSRRAWLDQPCDAVAPGSEL
jgi:predicted aminopeptidase